MTLNINGCGPLVPILYIGRSILQRRSSIIAGGVVEIFFWHKALVIAAVIFDLLMSQAFELAIEQLQNGWVSKFWVMKRNKVRNGEL